MSARFVVFDTVRVRAVRSGRCPACGQRVTRRKTFEATVNPFNRNADGTVRTEAEVRAHLFDDATSWVPNFRHAKCGAES